MFSISSKHREQKTHFLIESLAKTIDMWTTCKDVRSGIRMVFLQKLCRNDHSTTNLTPQILLTSRVCIVDSVPL